MTYRFPTPPVAITRESHPFGPSGIDPHYWTVRDPKYHPSGMFGPITDPQLHADYVNALARDNAAWEDHIGQPQSLSTEYLLANPRKPEDYD